MVRKRGGRKRALGIRAPMAAPQLPNDRWSLNFVSDQMASGRRFCILAIFDDCTRECLAAVADISLSGRRVARELDLLIARRGRPRTIVSDNGTELTSNAILGWAEQTVSVAPRPLRLFVRNLVSTVRRVIFCKGAHNGRPFGRHKTTVATY